MNRSSSALESVSIKFTLSYEGKITGTASAYLGAQLAPGQQWSFLALPSDAQPELFQTESAVIDSRSVYGAKYHDPITFPAVRSWR